MIFLNAQTKMYSTCQVCKKVPLFFERGIEEDEDFAPGLVCTQSREKLEYVYANVWEQTALKKNDSHF